MWISRKKYDDLVKASEILLSELEKVQTRPYLVNIERVGRINKFTFAIGPKIYQIETIGMLSDDVNDWKTHLVQ